MFVAVVPPDAVFFHRVAALSATPIVFWFLVFGIFFGFSKALTTFCSSSFFLHHFGVKGSCHQLSSVVPCNSRSYVFDQKWWFQRFALLERHDIKRLQYQAWCCISEPGKCNIACSGVRAFAKQKIHNRSLNSFPLHWVCTSCVRRCQGKLHSCHCVTTMLFPPAFDWMNRVHSWFQIIYFPRRWRWLSTTLWVAFVLLYKFIKLKSITKTS